MRRCSVKRCFRTGRFPVEGTIWHACYRHHPTSPYSAPTVEQVHADFEQAHREMVYLSNADLDTMVDEEAEMIEVCRRKRPFGFTPPPRAR